MDPLSIGASVTGLLIAGAQISSVLQRFRSSSTSASSLARVVHYEIHDFVAVLSKLQPYVAGATYPDPVRASMIDVDQLTTTLTGCVCTISELEKEVTGLEPRSQSRVNVRGRLKWAWSEQAITELIQRLQNHKLSLALILLILTSASISEASNSMNRLSSVVEQLTETNSKLFETTARMSNRLEMMESRLSFGASSCSSSTGIMHSTTFTPHAFETALFNTRVYKCALLRGFKSAESITTSKTSTTRLSVRSGVSIADVSDISGVVLPVCANDLYNPRWYYSRNTNISLPTSPISRRPSPIAPPAHFPHRDAFELHLTVKEGEIEAVREMIGQGVNKDTMDADGYTPLHWAAEYGNDGILELLLRAEVTVNIKTRGGDTPLSLAAEKGHTVIVDRLLEWCADIESKNTSGHSVLSLAAGKGKDEVVRILLGWGADTESKDRWGYTPMLLAAAEGHVKTVKILLEYDADKDARTSDDGSTPMHLAAFDGDEATLRLLLEHGAHREAMNIDGDTPLLVAAAGGYESAVLLLLECGAYVGVKNNEGNTALHIAASDGLAMPFAPSRGPGLGYAVWDGFQRIVKLLLDRGADTEEMNNDGYTALDLAVSNQRGPMTEILLRKYSADGLLSLLHL